MKSDNFNKTRRFIEKGSILWVIMVVIFLSMQYSVQILRSIHVPIEENTVSFITLISSVFLVYGIVMLPFILIMSVVLLYAEIGLNKLVVWRDNRQKKTDQ